MTRSLPANKKSKIIDSKVTAFDRGVGQFDWVFYENTTLLRTNLSNVNQSLMTFHYTDWFIGILIEAYYNPHITEQYNPLYTPKNQGPLVTAHLEITSRWHVHHTNQLVVNVNNQLGAKQLRDEASHSSWGARYTRQFAHFHRPPPGTILFSQKSDGILRRFNRSHL